MKLRMEIQYIFARKKERMRNKMRDRKTSKIYKEGIKIGARSQMQDDIGSFSGYIAKKEPRLSPKECYKKAEEIMSKSKCI